MKDAAPKKEPLTNWIMAAFTFGLFVTSILQWWAVRDTIASADRNFEIGDRAYVIAKGSTLYSSERKGQAVLAKTPGLLDLDGKPLTDAPVIEIDFVNSGRTPAREVVLKAAVDTPYHKILDNPVYPVTLDTQNPSKQVMGADEALNITVAVPIKPNVLSGIADGSVIIRTYGTIEYKDIFNKERHGSFCYFWSKARGSMANCVDHNEMD